MLLRKKHDAKAQMSYWGGAYGKMRAALEARMKHNTLEIECFRDTKKQKAGSYLAFGYVLFRSIPFHSVPFQVLLIS